MASIGLRNAKYNQIDYATKKYKTLTNSLVPVLGRLIDAKITEDRNNTELRADDIIAEKDLSFKGGTLSITVDDVKINGNILPVFEKGSEHKVEVVMG